MPLFSKEGDDTIYELEDNEEELAIAKSKGYVPMIEVTKDGQEYFAIPAEVAELKQAEEKGYKTSEQWDYLQKVKEESKVKFGAGEAFGLGAAEEGTLGLGKYAVAAGRSLLGGGPYGKELEALEYQAERAKEQQPLAYVGGRLAGGVGTGLVTGAIAPAATVAKTALKGAGVEAATGLITGTALSEEKDLGDKLLEGGVSGALLGGLTGGIGGALAKTPQAVEAAGELAGAGVQAARGTGKLLSSAQQALIESGRRTEGAGWITKQVDKLASLAENVKQNYSTLGETRALVKELREQMGEEVADIPDRQLLAYVSALPGPNPVKRWQASKIANATNGNVDEILQALETGPDAAAAARMFDKKATAEGIAVDMEGALNRLKPAMQKRYGELQEMAKQNFAKQGYDAQASLLEAMTKLSAKKSEEAGTIAKELQDIYAKFAGVPTTSLGELTEQGMSPTTRLLLEQRGGTRWSDLTPGEQFDILKKAREDIDGYFKQKGVYGKSSKDMTANQSIMKDVRDRINELIKTSDEMVENDATYKPFKDLEKILLQGAIKNEATGEITIVPEKMLALFKDTQGGGLLRKQIELAGLYAERLPAQESVEIKSVLDSINVALDAATQAKQLESVYKTSAKLTKSQVKGLEAFFGEGQLPIVGVVSPEDKVKSYARLVEFSKRFLQKDSFDQLSTKEKMALLELEALTRKKGMIGKDALLEATWQKIAKKKKLGV